MTPWQVAAGLVASVLLLLAPLPAAAQAAPARAHEAAAFDDAFAAAQARIAAAPRTLTATDVRRRLQAREGLLLIAPRGDDVDVFAVTRTRMRHVRLAGRSDPIRADIKALLCQVDERECAASRTEVDVQTPFDTRKAHALYAALVAPVEDALQGIDRLFVAASGPAAALPFGMLAVQPSAAAGGAPAWLADRYSLTTLPTVAHLRARGDAPGEPGGGPRPEFVGFGDSRWAGEAVRDAASVTPAAQPEAPMLRAELVPLEQASDELRAIARMLQAPAGSVHVGAAATETAVRTAPDLARAKVVAFATHGLLAGEIQGVDEPALVLTPAHGEDDGLLTASEVSKLKLTADWVILSACNTASPAREEEALSSLARAFLTAGAGSLLASHWRVFDDSAAALTVETLAAQRADPALTKAEALQRSMRTVRTGRRADGSPLPRWKPAWAHPAHWAPFVVISGG